MARGSGSLGQGASYYRLNLKAAGLETKARNAAGQWTKLQGVGERVNRKSVTQMSEWAAEHLGERVRRESGKFGRSGRLEAAVRNPKSHFVNKDGFEFMVAARMYEQTAYWRAIEHGSDHMVGRTIRLAFYKGGRRVPADQARTGTGFGARARGGLDSARVISAKTKKDGSFAKGGSPFVTIRRAIQPYGYGKAAVERFSANDYAWYRAAMTQELERSGFTTATAGRR